MSDYVLEVSRLRKQYQDQPVLKMKVVEKHPEEEENE